MWSSGKDEYRQLHEQLVGFLAHFGRLALGGRTTAAQQLLLTCKEPSELGLGYAQGNKQGSFIGRATVDLAIQLYRGTPQLHSEDLTHIEELGLFLPRIAEDRISDLTACVLREFFVRYTESEAKAHGVPTIRFAVPEVWDADALEWRTGLSAQLPYHPDAKTPLLFAPLDLLRHLPWINYADYYNSFYSRHVLPAKPLQRQVPKGDVLAHNRANYRSVQLYVAAKEKDAARAKPDPLFDPLAIHLIERRVRALAKLETGREAAREYESLVSDILTSALYPELEFAESQVRTVEGTHIRDLLFYNDGKTTFTSDLRSTYGAKQLVFELKNVRVLEPEHVNQLYRYLDADFGRIGVLVSRSEPPRAVRQNIVNLHSSKRVAIVCLTDADLALMLELRRTPKRRPIQALVKKYVEFTRMLPK